MEIGLQRAALPNAPAPVQPNPVAPTPVSNPKPEAANGSAYRAPAANDPIYNAPLHTQTESTLAPTSEYVRYLLLFLPARYIPRGLVGILYETEHYTKGLGKGILKLSEWFKKTTGITTNAQAKNAEAMVYNGVMGIGSIGLTASYSLSVYNDIKHVFSEAVAMENGKSPSAITRKDLQHSDNRIVQKTMDNFWSRALRRGFTDLLFLPAALARNASMGDIMVGTKAGLALGETWKRKTTMFEDLITFVNNKINPRNGLGQPVSSGDVFDLYQHYAEAFTPDRMFKNVVERGTGEGAVWAKSQPIFQRIAELMNLTYAYKHRSLIDPQTGRAIHQADFALPKFIYLLGHDLIDIHKPEETLARIEIANRYGIDAVKEMQTALKAHQPLEAILKRYPIPTLAENDKSKEKQDEKNGVIAKGSTMQLAHAEGLPATTITGDKINAATIIGSAAPYALLQ